MGTGTDMTHEEVAADILLQRDEALRTLRPPASPAGEKSSPPTATIPQSSGIFGTNHSTLECNVLCVSLHSAARMIAPIQNSEGVQRQPFYDYASVWHQVGPRFTGALRVILTSNEGVPTTKVEFQGQRYSVLESRSGLDASVRVLSIFNPYDLQYPIWELYTDVLVDGATKIGNIPGTGK
jgi:hypothetical protein